MALKHHKDLSLAVARPVPARESPRTSAAMSSRSTLPPPQLKKKDLVSTGRSTGRSTARSTARDTGREMVSSRWQYESQYGRSKLASKPCGTVSNPAGGMQTGRKLNRSGVPVIRPMARSGIPLTVRNWDAKDTER